MPTRKEKQAKAQKRREEIRDILVMGVRMELDDNGMDLNGAISHGDNLMRAMIKEQPQEKTLIMAGACLARDFIQEAIDKATVEKAELLKDEQAKAKQSKKQKVKAKQEKNAKCKHGKGMTDYCQPCGRVNNA